MSGLPPIPPRPDRTKTRSPAPANPANPASAPQPGGNGSTLGSDIPIIPPRPKRRIDRSQSPSKPLSPSIPTKEPAPAVAAPGIIIQTKDGSDLVALEMTSPPTATFPPTTLEPPMPEQLAAQREQDQTHTPIPEIRTVPEDLELQAPEPTVPRRSNTEKSDKLEAITRTDSAQVKEMDLEEPKEEVVEAPKEESKPVEDQLEPETHEAIMESVGQPEPVAEMDPDRRFSQDEGPRKPIEVDDDNGSIKVAEKKEEPAQPEPTQEQQDIVKEKMQEETEVREAEEETSTTDTFSGTRDSVSGQALSGFQSSMPEAHQDGAHVNSSGIQLEGTPTGTQDIEKDTLETTEKVDIGQNTSAHELDASEQIMAVPEPLKLGSNVPEQLDIAEVEEEKALETSMLLAPQEENKTDKNEVDEIMGEPAEPVSLATLKKECAVEDSSATNSPPTPQGEPSKSSIEAVSDFQGEHTKTQISEERPTTGAVAFHQEKRAEGIPLSTEEGRATTGVAAVISKPSIPARPKKKLADPKPLESKPVPVPAGLPQIDGLITHPVQEPAHALPSPGSKPPVPLASKPVIPPRPARPPRPVKKDSLNGSEGAPLTTVSSASSARSLFEAGGPEAAAAAKAKPKPPVPARPIGSKIAALQGGFLSELNKKLKIGPTAPVKEESPQEEERVEPPGSVPLVDQRKGRARGPQRRAPTRAAAPSKDTSPPAVKAGAIPALSLSLTAPMTVWEVAPEDGDIKLPFGATTTTKSEKVKVREPEVEVKIDASTVTESKPEIAEEALPITKEESKELEETQEDIGATTPPAVSEAEQDAQTGASSWRGTTALGEVAMSAPEVISQTAASASKTIRDFTEGEEHVLSDVENKDSAAVSEVESTPASPQLSSVIQNDGPNEIEAQADSLAAPELAAAAEVAVPLAQPPKLEKTQHPSETDFPLPLQSSEAPTVLRSPDSAETEISINTAATKVAAPEAEPVTPSVAELMGLSASGVVAEGPEMEVIGDVPVPASAVESTPLLPDNTIEQLKELKEVEEGTESMTKDEKPASM